MVGVLLLLFSGVLDVDYDPFTVGEIIAIRDEPKGWFFVVNVFTKDQQAHWHFHINQ